MKLCNWRVISFVFLSVDQLRTQTCVSCRGLRSSTLYSNYCRTEVLNRGYAAHGRFVEDWGGGAWEMFWSKRQGVLVFWRPRPTSQSSINFARGRMHHHGALNAEGSFVYIGWFYVIYWIVLLSLSFVACCFWELFALQKASQAYVRLFWRLCPKLWCHHCVSVGDTDSYVQYENSNLRQNWVTSPGRNGILEVEDPLYIFFFILRQIWTVYGS